MPDILEEWRRQQIPPGFIEEVDLLKEWRTQQALVKEPEKKPTKEPTWWEAAFGPPKEYEEVYAPELGKMVPGKRAEIPLGTKIIEDIKTDWVEWIGLGIFLGTYGALKAIPIVGESIISKNAAKFAKTNLPVFLMLLKLLRMPRFMLKWP